MAGLLGVTAQSVFRYENVSLPDTKILYKYRGIAIEHGYSEVAEVFAKALVEATGIPRDALPFEPGGPTVDEILHQIQSPPGKSDRLSGYSADELDAISAVIEMMRADDQELWPMIRRGIRIWRLDHPNDKTQKAGEGDHNKPGATHRRRRA